ncbi:MAG: DUF1592 domain-containing protein [Pirellulales bacterium]
MPRSNCRVRRVSSHNMARRAATLASICVALALATSWFVGAAAEPPASDAASETDPFARLGDTYGREVLPLLKTYCLDCHSTETKEGELDLEQFVALADVRREPPVWQRVAEMLAGGEMPPKDADQPTADERRALRDWVGRYLDVEARANAGDPGRVVLRRLSNAEYTYTLRDLTGIDVLDPASEFPVDGAAGEGFTNTGSALVMSPALLTKYLDAGKSVAEHAVLLSDGIRFSPHTTRRDWTNDILDEIRAFYAPYSDASGATRVNLQGLVWDTNEGGRLPLERYLAVAVVEREAIAAGTKTIDAAAAEHGVNAKYLSILYSVLTDGETSPLLDPIRARWRAAKPADVPAIVAEIQRWQQVLWKFSSVGHIGKVGGPKAWMEPVSPVVASQDVRSNLAPAASGDEATFYLSATPVLANGNAASDENLVVWRAPRLVTPGQADLPLRDVAAVSRAWLARRDRMFASTAKCLAAVAEVQSAAATLDAADLARRHGVDADSLSAWLEYLGLDSAGTVEIGSLLTKKTSNGANYEFISGWTSGDLPSVVANSSDQHVRIPGNMKPHGVAMHPSPTLSVAAGWRSPVASKIRVEGTVVHAHPECGNGVTWSLEFRRGALRRRLASGVAQGGTPVKLGPIDQLSVQPGDFVSLVVGPRDGNHSCDLTAVDVVLTEVADGGRAWNLAADVSPNILAGNPHADQLGNDSVWHFYTEPVAGVAAAGPAIPDGSLLARWLAATAVDERRQLADALASLLSSGPPKDEAHPDAKLYRQLMAYTGPLLRKARQDAAAGRGSKPTASPPTQGAGDWGVDPALFGHIPAAKSAEGTAEAIDANSLCVAAPSALVVRLPAGLAAGWEFVASGSLHVSAGEQAAVQLQATVEKPAADAGLRADLPIVVRDAGQARQRVEKALDDFRRVFPPALCYTKIVPVDEVVTLTLFYREDEQLRRLMLDDERAARLDRLWDELHYVSRDALTLVDAYLQLMEYATQDADPSVFEPLRKPINDRAAAFRRRLADTEPQHVEAVLRFAALAYRRPLTDGETAELRALYERLRNEDIAHDEAVRLTLARVFVSPAFLYKLETPPTGKASGPVSDSELASRLSYFLWSSVPDTELRVLAAAGKLHDDAVLRKQVRRMLGDAKVRRLATEFACQWLHIRDVAELDEKSERHFPTFLALRGAMQEESTRFFADLFARGGSVLEILDADHTFLNESLARHYGIEGVEGEAWRRVDGMKARGRGGVLAQAATLAKQSGASRTSPILRGTWISEVLLGERMPRPPKNVPPLPDEAASAELTVRQLVERHVSDPKCAVCHRRFDHYGFALENFDAIGRWRDKDLGKRAIDAHATTQDGFEMNGVAGLREYLLTKRRDDFVRQFCRKLLGYALGRSVQLSDEPLLGEMRTALGANEYDVGLAVEMIVLSRQFREIRGRDAAGDE